MKQEAYEAIDRLSTETRRFVARLSRGCYLAGGFSTAAPTDCYPDVVARLVTTTLLWLGLPAMALAQFTSYSKNPKNILEGNWQSCREADGVYSERIYEHRVNGVPKFEVHMGPKREFAIFPGVQDEHRDHSSPDNLLKPYRIDVEGNLASHEWKIPSLNLVFSVTLAGGSRSDCESWYILLAPLNRASH